MGVFTLTSDRESYLQCPYCSFYTGGHGVKIPKTVGKYKVMVLHNTILKFKCARCAKEFKMVLGADTKHMWSKMTRQEREKFKKQYYKGGQK